MSSGRLVWFVAGASIGATLALLFAPESGEATRHRIGKQARKGKRAFSEAGQEVFDKGRDLYDRGREVADEVADKGRDLYDRGREVADEVADEAADLFDRGRQILER